MEVLHCVFYQGYKDNFLEDVELYYKVIHIKTSSQQVLVETDTLSD